MLWYMGISKDHYLSSWKKLMTMFGKMEMKIEFQEQ